MRTPKAQPIKVSATSFRVRAEQPSSDGLEYMIWTFDVINGALVPCWVRTRTRESKRHEFRIVSQNPMADWEGVPADVSAAVRKASAA